MNIFPKKCIKYNKQIFIIGTYDKRYAYNNNYTINWQFLNLNEFMQYLKKTLIEDIDLIINSKIDDLHLKEENFENTFCEKNICDNCKFNK